MIKKRRINKKKIDQDFQNRIVRLKSVRSKETGKRCSYTKIAEDSNLDCAVVKRIMKGERGATLSEAYALASGLDTTVEHLSNMSQHSLVEKGYFDLIQILNNQRHQTVKEIEYLKTQLELIDAQVAIHKSVSQIDPSPI